MRSTKSANRWGTGAAVTLQQVAEMAGVHPMTVSRAIQGSDKVAPATRENILRIAKELNYTPNAAARALVMGKTQTIAVVTGPVSESYYASLLHLLEIELTASDYKMLVLRSRDLNHDLMSLINTNAVDGVIAVDAFPRIDELVQAKGTFIPPCVYAGAANPEWVTSLPIDAVKIDLSRGVRDALQAMLSTGCRRVAYVVANEGMGSAPEVRSRVYDATLEAANRPLEVVNLGIGGDTSNHDFARRRLTAYIEARGCPDGLFCQNDEIAIAAYRTLRDLGLRIPDDVQLVGCDGLAYMDYFDPQLSTIVQPAEQMCAMAWELLQRRMSEAHAPRQQETLMAPLRVRPSLKVFKGETENNRQ